MSDHEDQTETETARPRARRAVPSRPLGAKRPQDRKRSAAQREAEADETVTVEYEGYEFDIPADQDDWPILALQAFTKNLNIDGIEHLLGPRQWAVFVTNFTKMRDFNAFAEVVSAEFGFGSSGN